MRDIPAGSLEAFVVEVLVEDLRQRTDIKRISAMMKYTAECRATQNRLKGLDKATRNVMRVLEHGCTEEVVEKLKALSATRSSLKQKLHDYENCSKGIDADNLEKITVVFSSHWNLW